MNYKDFNFIVHFFIKHNTYFIYDNKLCDVALFVSLANQVCFHKPLAMQVITV